MKLDDVLAKQTRIERQEKAAFSAVSFDKHAANVFQMWVAHGHTTLCHTRADILYCTPLFCINCGAISYDLDSFDVSIISIVCSYVQSHRTGLSHQARQHSAKRHPPQSTATAVPHSILTPLTP